MIRWSVLLVLLAAAAVPGAAADRHRASGQDPHQSPHPPHQRQSPGPAPGSADAEVGATVEALIAMARRLNPELAARTLEADAAAARVRGADALPDPELVLEMENIRRARPSYAPSLDIKTYKLSLEQRFPLFKLEPKRRQAEADHRAARHEAAALELALVARVKAAYARYHQVHVAADLTRTLLGIVRTVERLAQARYGEGVVQQGDVVTASLERVELTNELTRLEAERHQSRAQINALLARPGDAPLVERPRPRPIPPEIALAPQPLLARALAVHPMLRVAEAKIDAADQGRVLADRSWIPDLALGIGVEREGTRWESYQAMVGLSLPLQTELRRSQQSEAAAMAGAARHRLDNVRLEIERDLRQALASLQAARSVSKVLSGTALPQARIGVDTAIKGYEVGVTDFLSVLESVRRLQRTQIELARVDYDMQIMLAEIERLIGGVL